MTTILIIIVVIAVILITRAKSSNPKGTDKNFTLEGYGEFGLEMTNPIPTRSIPASYSYLDRLELKMVLK